VLALLPMNRSGDALSQMLAGSADGEPGPVSWIDHSAASVTHGLGLSIALVFAVLAIVIGLGVIATKHNTAFLTLGVLLSIGLWVVGQNFGELATGSATDVNAGPLFVLLAAVLYRNPVLFPVTTGGGSAKEPERVKQFRDGGLLLRSTATLCLVAVSSWSLVAGGVELGHGMPASDPTGTSMTPTDGGDMHIGGGSGGQDDMEPGGQGIVRVSTN
jgi:hypothetical protein